MPREDSTSTSSTLRALIKKLHRNTVAQKLGQYQVSWSFRPWDKGGGGRSQKNIFFRPFVWSKKRGDGAPRPLRWVRHCSAITLKSDQENDHGHLQEKFGTAGSSPRTFSVSWPHHHHLYLFTKSYHLYMVFLGIVSWESMLIYLNKRRRLTVAVWRVRPILTLTPCDKISDELLLG